MANIFFNFIETAKFTREVQRILTDYEYTKLQWRLIEFPDAGDVIPGGGGQKDALLGERQGHKKRSASDILFCSIPRQDFCVRHLFQE